MLALSNCQLTALPAALLSLPSLQGLNVSRNAITHVPTIPPTCALHYLDLSNNELAELPPTIVNAASLEVMLLHNNALPHLPLQLR